MHHWGETGWFLRFSLLVSLSISLVWADKCPAPEVTNGRFDFDGEKQENFLFGEVVCDKGFLLIGSSSKIKCRHGIWSQRDIPRCGALGSCSALAQLHNGRNIPVQNSRGSAFRFKCNRGFKRFGVRDTHCNGDSWSHGNKMPICTKNTCDKTAMLDVPYGQGKSLMHGAVFKYRCNPGAEMEGGDTVACTGQEWTGSVPQCNVVPSQPSLELIVRGNVVSQVRHNDWVLVSCQGRGGHPPPEIGLRFDGKPFATKDFRVWRNTFTFIAKSEDNGKKIECTATNKVGSANSVSELNVLSAPSSVKISGPDTINRNSNYTYTCKVAGGNPMPTMRWKVNDVSMSGVEMEMEEGQARLTVVTGEEERKMTVSCIAENSLGVVSRSLHVDAEYLPQRIMIQAPATIMEGEEAAVSCLTSQSHPAPRVTWKLEKVGATHEIREKVSGETTLVVGHEGEGDGGRLYRAGFVIEETEDISYVQVSCRAVVKGLGEVDSDIMKIIVEKRPEEEEEEVEYSTPAYTEIINKEDRAAITDLNTGEIIVVGDDEEDSDSSEEYAEDVTNPAVEAEESQTTPTTTEDYHEEKEEEKEEKEEEEEKDATDSQKAANFVKLVRADGEKEEEKEEKEEEEEKDATDSQKASNFVKLVRADGEKFDEMDGTKENPWIPFDDNKDIEYQYEVEAERENQADQEGFFQASKLTEPKHASDQKSPAMMIDPISSVVGSGAPAGFNNYFVRFTLTLTLSSAIALKYLY